MKLNSQIVANAFQLYKEHFRMSLLFGLLLIFIGFFSIFPNIVFSSGSFFWEYSFLGDIALIAELFGVLLFLVFYSLFVSAMIIVVRKELSKVKVVYYFSEMVKKFAFRLFTFFVLFIFGLIILGSLLVWVGVPIFLINLLFLLLSCMFIFVPQVIVVDELSISLAMIESYDFIFKNRGIFALILVLGSAVLALTLLVDYFLDAISPTIYLGRIISFCIVLFFLIPFMEVLKTYVYMLKFGLVHGVETIKHLRPYK